MTASLFAVGLSGTALTEGERAILDRHPPRGVILFRRNIETAGQVKALTRELSRRGLIVLVDQEGGPVDRLKEIVGASISFREAAVRGIARDAGRAAGDACARLGVSVDLAPVVDRRIAGASEGVMGDRCASEDPAAVARAAGEFLSGLQAAGIGGCIKHFPGLGRAALDTHRALPVVPADPRERARDLLPFRKTARHARAVMVSHAAGPDGVPASLSSNQIGRVLRGRLGYRGAVFSDDLEMGALSAFGDLPARCAVAARAGCDLLLVCSRIEEYPACVEAVDHAVSARRHHEASSRLDRYAAHLARIRRAAPPAPPIARIAARIARLRSV